MFTKLHDLYTWNFQKEVTNLTPRSGWILLQCVHFGLAVYFIGGKGGRGDCVTARDSTETGLTEHLHLRSPTLNLSGGGLVKTWVFSLTCAKLLFLQVNHTDLFEPLAGPFSIQTNSFSLRKLLVVVVQVS